MAPAILSLPRPIGEHRSAADGNCAALRHEFLYLAEAYRLAAVRHAPRRAGLANDRFCGKLKLKSVKKPSCSEIRFGRQGGHSPSHSAALRRFARSSNVSAAGSSILSCPEVGVHWQGQGSAPVRVRVETSISLNRLAPGLVRAARLGITG